MASEQHGSESGSPSPEKLYSHQTPPGDCIVTLPGFATLVFITTLGGFILVKMLTVGFSAVGSAGPPLAAVEGGAAAQGQAAAKYFQDNPQACAQIDLDEDLVKRFPELPAVVAALKFSLAQHDWLETAAISGKTNLRITRPSFSDRVKLLSFLNDPNLQFKLASALPSGVKGGVANPNAINFGNSGAADPTLKNSPTPYGLADTIIHELVHIKQMREGGLKSYEEGSDPGKEAEASSYEAFMPRTLFAGDAWEAFKKASPCEGASTAGPADKSKITGSVILILDASGSMSRALPSGQTRMQAAKQSVKAFLKSKLPPTLEVGLIIYSDCNGIEWHEFTTNHQSLIVHVDIAEPTNGTPLAKSIDVAVDHMKKDAAKNGQAGDIVVVSDGEESCAGKPETSAENGHNSRIPGSKPTNRLPVLTPGERYVLRPAQQELSGIRFDFQQSGGEIKVSTIGLQVGGTVADAQLKAISQKGGGSYFAADDVQGLSTGLQGAVKVPAAPAPPEVLNPDDLKEDSGGSPFWIAGGAAVGVLTLALIYLVYRREGRLTPAVAPALLAPGCSYCGAANNPASTHFCLFCGNPLPASCANCGQSNVPGMRFCSNCGGALSS